MTKPSLCFVQVLDARKSKKMNGFMSSGVVVKLSPAFIELTIESLKIEIEISTLHFAVERVFFVTKDFLFGL